LYGFDSDSTIADPDDPRKTFSYLICPTWDNTGNATVYSHVADDSIAVDKNKAREATPSDALCATQRYLKSASDSNTQSYRPDGSPQQPETPLPVD
jgi:hypothetical protein